MKGMRFGRWTVITGEIIDDECDGNVRVACQCECGVVRNVLLRTLQSKTSTSCGCRRTEVAKVCHIKHGAHVGKKKTATYLSWDNMMQRCNNVNRNEWFYYGARGIKVCDRWLNYENFLADMGERPKGKSLDRIDPNGNYEPVNCKWSTPMEQAQNKRPRSCYKHNVPTKFVKTIVP